MGRILCFVKGTRTLEGVPFPKEKHIERIELSINFVKDTLHSVDKVSLCSEPYVEGLINRAISDVKRGCSKKMEEFPRETIGCPETTYTFSVDEGFYNKYDPSVDVTVSIVFEWLGCYSFQEGVEVIPVKFTVEV